MNIKRILGIDTLQEKYAYSSDPRFGYTSTEKIPDHWVPTTCGYCSVGCGMLIGVKDGKAITVRGDEDHPVNHGKLCPKGLSEHYMIEADTRAKYPMLRQNGKLARVSWDTALSTMVEKFTAVQAKYGKDALGIIGTGQLVTEEFYTLGKLAQIGFGTKNYCGNTTLCMASAVAGYKRTFGGDGPPGAYEDLEKADVILLIGANIADNHPILCQRLEKTSTGLSAHLLKPRSFQQPGGNLGLGSPAISAGDFAIAPISPRRSTRAGSMRRAASLTGRRPASTHLSAIQPR